MKYRVNSNCIGCELCTSVCPEVFQMTNDGVAEAYAEPSSEAEENTAAEAKDSCPSDAIEEA